MRIVTEEQFGPALSILPFDDVDSVLHQVNNDWSGLCSSVWSGDPARAAAFAERLRTGTTWINHANAVACDDRVPFGGFCQSGIGRDGPRGPALLHRSAHHRRTDRNGTYGWTPPASSGRGPALFRPYVTPAARTPRCKGCSDPGPGW
ncbi:aldehyde dehydrogenase family protein [Streptomyces sp. NPDC020898]|uniref:aldehyde dehydrogenase family protein n=1 Tax=Streptomyces sp. NPDC020898 TaxID=3365101 RepID=UPI0037A5C5C2